MVKEFHEGSAIGCMMRRGDSIWIGTEDNVVICDISTAKPRSTLTGHKATVTSLVTVGQFFSHITNDHHIQL